MLKTQSVNQDSESSAENALLALYERLEAAASSLPLATCSTDIVPGEGNARAKVMFIGEAPGEQEAKLRRPFVGRSGQLFRKVLTETGLLESEVYISNIVKVRPPENRDPLLPEIIAYQPYLNEEIEIIRPRLIATLGRFSMAKFMPDVKVSQVHGRLHKIIWNGRVQFVLPLYHPAAALRAPLVMKAFVEDLQKLPKIMSWIDAKIADEALQTEVAESLL